MKLIRSIRILEDVEKFQAILSEKKEATKKYVHRNPIREKQIRT